MRTLLIFPMTFEAKVVFKKLGFKGKLKVGAECTSADGNVSAIIAGIGCEMAVSRVVEAAKKASPDVAMLCGFCGACDGDLKIGDMIYDGDLKYLPKDLNVKTAKLAFARRIVEEKEKSELFKEGYAGVDMESEIFRNALVELNSGIKFNHFRVVSDALKSKIPAELLESMINLKTGESSIPLGVIFRKIFRRPKLAIDLLSFAKEVAPAQKIYNKSILKILNSL